MILDLIGKINNMIPQAPQKTADELFEGAVELFDKGRYKTSAKDMYQAIDLGLGEGKIADAWFIAGKAETMIKDKGAAINNFKNSLNHNPDSGEACYRIACLMVKGEDPETLYFFDRAIEMHNNQTDSYYNQADAYYGKADAMLRLHRSEAGTYKKNVVRESVGFLDTCISLDPAFSGAYHTRGQLHEMLGKSTKALRDYEKAATIWAEENAQEDLKKKKKISSPYTSDLMRLQKELEK